MKKLLIGILVGVLGTVGWNHLHPRVATVEKVGASDAAARVNFAEPADSRESVSTPESRFRCDGRVYCSQMTSCEEAEFFLQNCPGVKMDGGGDGVPCERQWCGNR